MKTLIILTLLALTCSGCVQLIDERPDGSRFKVNSLCNSTGFDGLYWDPNGFMEVNKYIAIPADIELYIDPITKRIGFKSKTNELPDK